MVRYWYPSVMPFSNLAFLLRCWSGPGGTGSCLIPIRYTHVVSRHRSIRVQMTWWKTCAISAGISQGHIPCLPSTPKTAFGRKSCCCVCVCVCVCSESERAITALAPGRRLPHVISAGRGWSCANVHGVHNIPWKLEEELNEFPHPC